MADKEDPPEDDRPDNSLSDDSLLAAAENLLSSTDNLIAGSSSKSADQPEPKNPGFGFQFETAVTDRTTRKTADNKTATIEAAIMEENAAGDVQKDSSNSVDSTDAVSGESDITATPNDDSTPNTTDENWGFSSRRTGMARETKIGMALILLLLGAFGYVVYRKTTEPTVLNIDGIAPASRANKLAGKSSAPGGGSAETPSPGSGIPSQSEPTGTASQPKPSGLIQPIGFDQNTVASGSTGVETLQTQLDAANAARAASETPQNPFGQLPQGRLTQGNSVQTATATSNAGSVEEFNPFAGSGATTAATSNSGTQPVQPIGHERPVSLDDGNLVPFEQTPSGQPATNPPGEIRDAFQQPIERANSNGLQPPVQSVSSSGASTQVHPLFDGANVTESSPTANPLTAANEFSNPLNKSDAFVQNDGAFKFDDGSAASPEAGATNAAKPMQPSELDALLERGRATEAPTNGEPRIIRETTMPIDNRTASAPGSSTDPIRPVQPFDPVRAASPPASGTYLTESPNEFTLDSGAVRNLDGQPQARIHVVDVGENFWTISRKYYKTGRFNQALNAYNSARIPDARKMRPKMKVMIPSIETLQAKYPKLCPRVPGTATSVGQGRPGFFVDRDGNPAYRAGASDTLGSVAQQHLGRASRWIQIYKLNQDRVKNPDKLPIGTVLRLPADASNVRIVGRGQTIR